MMLAKVLAEFEKVKDELSITDDEFLRCCYNANMIVARKDEHSLKALQYWCSKVNELLCKDSQGRLELKLTVDDLLIIAMVKELAQLRYFKEDKEDSITDFIGWMLLYLRYRHTLLAIEP